MRGLLQFGMALIVISVGCHSNREPAQVSNVPGQMDKVLFERAAQAYAQNQYLDIFTSLETLKNTWPESPYVDCGKNLSPRAFTFFPKAH